MNMTAGGNYYNACSSAIGSSLNTTIKLSNSTNKIFNAIDPNQFFAKTPMPANVMTTNTTTTESFNGCSRRGSTMSTPIGNFLQDEYATVIANDFDMGFDLNSYDIDEAASSSSGSHLAFSCTDPNILSDIPSRYLIAFNNIQNENM